MRDGDYEHRGVVVSGIEWDNLPYPEKRVCSCGRPDRAHLPLGHLPAVHRP